MPLVYVPVENILLYNQAFKYFTKESYGGLSQQVVVSSGLTLFRLVFTSVARALRFIPLFPSIIFIRI